MAGQLTPPFAYRAGNTILHRAPAGLKLLCVAAVSAAAFISVYGLAASCALLLAAAAIARASPRELLKGSRPLVFLSACVVAIKLKIPNVSAGGFIEGIIAVMRIFVPYAAASLLFTVTTMGQLRASLAAVEIKVKQLFLSGKNKNAPPAAYFSLGISLMLGFIPRFFYLWEISNMACEARSCKRGPRRLVILIPLVAERMMEAAALTALALEARALGNEK